MLYGSVIRLALAASEKVWSLTEKENGIKLSNTVHNTTKYHVILPCHDCFGMTRPIYENDNSRNRKKNKKKWHIDVTLTLLVN